MLYYYVLILMSFSLLSCSDGETVDELFGTSDNVIEVPPENNLIITIDSPSSGSPVGYMKSLSGECGTAGLVIEVYGDFTTTYTACGADRRWTVNVDVSTASVGNIAVNARMIDGETIGNPASLTLNKLSSACDTEAARNDTFANASGAAPWQVCTALQFANINTVLNDDVVIMNDINFNSGSFTAIGNTGGGYTGTLEGNNFTLSNININSTNTQQAIFREATGATFQNLNIDNINVIGDQYVAALVAYVEVGTNVFSNINISNVTLTSNEGSNNAYVGALFGLNRNGASDFTISNITVSNVSITADKDYQGGLVGYLNVANSVDVDDISINGGEIAGRQYVGGVFGRVHDANTDANSTFDNISNTANISTTNGNVGGIAGRASGAWTNVSNTGVITRTSSGNNFGGLFGYFRDGTLSGTSTAATRDAGNTPPNIPSSDPPTSASCYNTGNVVANGANNVGGLIGYVYRNAFSVNSCYNTANVSGGTSYVGGIAGYAERLVLNDSFSSGTILGTGNYVGGISGRTRNVSGNSSLSNTYASGIVNSTSLAPREIGGLVGRWEGAGGMTDVWFNGNIVLIDSDDTGQIRYVGGIVGNYRNGASTCLRCNSAGNINIASTGVTNNHSDVGGIMGYSRADITDSSSSMNITAAQVQNVGGISGYDYRNAYNNVSSSGNISGRRRIGGLIGSMNNTNTSINDSHSTANISVSITSGDAYAGGLAGYSMANIRRSYFAGTVTATDTNYVGGIEGGINSNQNREIVSCLNTGDIDAGTGIHVGGISGYFHGRSNRFLNNLSTGEIKGGDRTGGLVGTFYRRGPNSMRYSYSISQVVRANGGAGPNNQFGPLVGRIQGSSDAIDPTSNYYNTGIVPEDESSGLAIAGPNLTNVNGLSSAQMLVPANFVNFDFGTPEWEMPSANFQLPGENVIYQYPIQDWLD